MKNLPKRPKISRSALTARILDLERRILKLEQDAKKTIPAQPSPGWTPYQPYIWPQPQWDRIGPYYPSYPQVWCVGSTTNRTHL